MFAPCDAPGLRVWFDEEKCYLHAPDFEALADATAVHDRGELLVRRLNGLGLLKFGSFRPVTAGSVRGPGAGSITVFPGTATLYLPSRAWLRSSGLKRELPRATMSRAWQIGRRL